MAHEYSEHRDRVFTEEGHKLLLQIRDRAFKLIRESGAATLGRLVAESSGDSWLMLACVDRLVELGDLKCVYKGNAGQYSVYTSKSLLALKGGN